MTQFLSIISHRDVDGAGGVALDDVPGDGGHPGVGHPHRGQSEVCHVQECVPRDEVIPPTAVRVLSQEPRVDKVLRKNRKKVFVVFLCKVGLCMDGG